uniref:E2 ubiquitin-conjugating enzyme n=1 Tax=Vannella robusta TaxID=1487602 RepID=A0A6U1UEC3_9EUKA|mmetsp:Transcript_20635/g.26097  ORF Transcript_20635/g.26097 Transcript_20635/m.26097 type:complete len:194 (+) Transcript_20635:65-646(+)
MNENIAPSVMRRILNEVADLTRNAPEGVKIIPVEDDLSEVHAIIAGPEQTPFENGSFRVKLKFGAEFPQAPPKGYFLTKIFHPNVSNNGEICVNTLKKDWKEELGLRHVLVTIKCLLIHPNPESALNEEAGRLLLEDYEDYAARAKLMTSIHAKAEPSNSGGSTPPAPSAPAKTVAKRVQRKQILRKKSLKRL